MTLKELIEELTEIMADEGEAIEVVSVDNETDERYAPIISIGTDSDGVRRMRLV